MILYVLNSRRSAKPHGDNRKIALCTCDINNNIEVNEAIFVRGSMNPNDVPSKNIGRPSGSTGEITAPRILKVAMRVFGKRGYKAASMKDIAKAADLTVGSIYHYYPSKADLFVAAGSELYVICHRIFSKLLDQNLKFSERLTILLTEGKEFFKAEEDLQRFAMGLPTELRHHHELRQALAPQYNRFAELYRRVAADAHARGELPKNTSPAIVAIILEVLLSTAFPQMARAAGEDFEQIVVQLDNILQKGLCGQ